MPVNKQAQDENQVLEVAHAAGSGTVIGQEIASLVGGCIRQAEGSSSGMQGRQSVQVWHKYLTYG